MEQNVNKEQIPYSREYQFLLITSGILVGFLTNIIFQIESLIPSESHSTFIIAYYCIFTVFIIMVLFLVYFNPENKKELIIQVLTFLFLTGLGMLHLAIIRFLETVLPNISTRLLVLIPLIIFFSTIIILFWKKIDKIIGYIERKAQKTHKSTIDRIVEIFLEMPHHQLTKIPYDEKEARSIFEEKYTEFINQNMDEQKLKKKKKKERKVLMKIKKEVIDSCIKLWNENQSEKSHKS